MPYPKHRLTPRSGMLILVFFSLLAQQGFCQSPATLGERIGKILARYEYRHATFGIEFYSLDSGKVLYTLNTDKLFMPASTTKLLTVGAALNLLGPDYRFHTRVCHSGLILENGMLDGDLILVASGDPNLSSRVQPDGTLAFENLDHSLSGSPSTRAVPGDPLIVIRELAKQVAAHGIKQIKGRIVVDTSLFPEIPHETGTESVISPIVVNDNLIDINIGPGPSEGSPTIATISPQTPYLQLINKVTTGKADSEADVNEASDSANPDGSHTVTVSGSFPLGKAPILYAYPVPSPSRFAEVALVQALQQAGVTATVSAAGDRPDFNKYASAYVPGNVVAEYTSPPFSEEVKVTLKVSQNLHAAMAPSLLGALVAHKPQEAEQAGFDLEHDFLEKAGLDLSGAVQADGAGGFAFFTPDFMVRYLVFLAGSKYNTQFQRALPILGRDGTLWDILPNSSAAGHVFAKTGTTGGDDKLNHKLIVTAKGLVGYMTTAAGERLVFAIYVNNVSVPMGNHENSTRLVGTILGEIAAAAYESR